MCPCATIIGEELLENPGLVPWGYRAVSPGRFARILVLQRLHAALGSNSLQQSSLPRQIQSPVAGALAAVDGVTRAQSADREGAKLLGRRRTTIWRRLQAQAMADPVYDRIDLIALTLALVLAAGIVLLLAQIMPQLADLM